MDIVTYLNNNNIIIDENFFGKNDRNSMDISNQLDLIIMAHNRIINNKITIIPRINSTIGKDVESFKLQVKKVEKLLKRLSLNNNKSDLEYYLLEKGDLAIKRAKKSIDNIDNDNYLSIIRRSMKNYEICLGRVDEGNLKLIENDIIKIRTAKYISYNLIEHDLFNYIKRTKRRDSNIEIEKIIDEFIYKSSLSEKSKNYLISLVNYPVETMKLIYKYNNDNKGKYDEWVKKINMAIDIDGDEII